MAPYVAMIHGIDSYKLLVEVNKQAQKCSRVIPCLLQIHIAEEETKFGFSFDECREMLQKGDWKELHHIQISGVMGMATYFTDTESFKEISMGMSHDYPIAIREGSTMVRVGSKIFGERNY